jgi:hypothetical protein
MAESSVRRSASVQKILQHNAPRHEPEVEEANESHQLARAHSREAIMLDVKKANGEIESFPYFGLSRVTYKPGDTLILRFGGNEITIEGRNLSRLRDIVSEHRARFIQEGTETEEGFKAEEAAHVEKIEIKNGEEEC